MRQRARAGNLTICYREKQIDHSLGSSFTLSIIIPCVAGVNGEGVGSQNSPSICALPPPPDEQRTHDLKIDGYFNQDLEVA